MLPSASLARPLFHESGALLFSAGERLGDEEISILRRVGIKRIYDFGGEEGASASTAGEDSRTGPPPEPREPDVPPEDLRAFQRERRATAGLRAIERAAAGRLAPDRLIVEPRGELRDAGIERAIALSRASDRPEGTPWKDRLQDFRPEAPRPAADKGAALAVRRSLIARLEGLFASLRSGGGLPGGAGFLYELVSDLCALAVRDPDLAIALALSRFENGEGFRPDAFLARHSFSVATLALAAAIELGYALEQIVEIAHAALLHDVGMVRLPESLARKPGALDDEERRELERHPLHAIEVVRRFPEVPLALVAVAIEEHERLDGSGYPKGAADTGELARIVAVADVFEALSAPRPHRPARSPHAAVREAVALAARKKLDSKVLRAMFKAVSLFPLGSYLRLTDGALVRVVRAGGPDASRPVVAVLGPSAKEMLVDLAARPDLRVAAADVDRTPEGSPGEEPPPAPVAVPEDPLAGF